jgi:VWFA-related protein
MSVRTGGLLMSFAIGASLVAQVAPPQNLPPTFRAGVEYVEVDARVVNRSNEPVLGLSQRDFQVFEDGVKQDIASFTAVNIPVPSSGSEFRPPKPSAVELMRPDTATNARQLLDGRVYLIALDDLYIDPVRTPGVRRFLTEFIDRSIGPNDQAAVVNLGQGGAFQNFTNERPC